MADTDFYFPPEKRDRAAVVYRQDAETGALEPVAFQRHDAPPAFCGGGGGLISTADDYLKFARMLLNGGEVDGVRLLKPETVALMRDQPADRRPARRSPSWACRSGWARASAWASP